jgi:hypothetical protein
MEAILAKQIEKDALLCGALSPHHVGGIKQTSAIDAVIAILNPISNSLSSTRNTKTIAERYLASPSLLCMDIQGAFNATSTKILANIMHFRKMPKYQVEWVRAMGQDRQLSFSFDKIEDPQPASDVLPQGSPSSPILFAIMAAAILEIPPPSIGHLQGSQNLNAIVQKSDPLKLHLPFQFKQHHMLMISRFPS